MAEKRAAGAPPKFAVTVYVRDDDFDPKTNVVETRIIVGTWTALALLGCLEACEPGGKSCWSFHVQDMSDKGDGLGRRKVTLDEIAKMMVGEIER